MRSMRLKTDGDVPTAEDSVRIGGALGRADRTKKKRINETHCTSFWVLLGIY